ncbi:uncharacterized protein LTR77_002757 [Saxophila tyrrhenica]|uniref:Uncharacterized protein n=1 Tax=Saxophila tyrrhenica TaxID=1690608 RepID=A0AAV9PIN7_9PEZI|nr:hypothetical protein LTR77_002757 [Saxophila tyrrhenica]
MPGIKGKRVPGRPGRFDPTEPLHMTTRRAAKRPTTNGSPSLSGTADEDDSRRGSFDDARPLTSYSNGSQRSAKSRRLSDISVPAVTPEGQMNGIHLSEGKVSDEHQFQPLPPIEQSPKTQPQPHPSPSPSPSRKRKRSPSPQPHSSPQHPDSTATTSFENNGDVSPNYEEEMEGVEVVRPDELSDREVPASQATSRSDDDAMQLDDGLMAPSMDQTPAISGQISPVTSESKSQDDIASAKKLGAALEIARAERDEQDKRDDLGDIVEAADEIDEVDEVDGQVRSEDDGRPRKGRFGGRRRATHAIPRVERAMQRQSELKSAYRAIARAQKAVLAEIAQRTTDDLEASTESHSQATEYEEVRAGLEYALAERKRRINAQHEMNMAQLRKTFEAQQEVEKGMTRRNKEVVHDEQLDRLKHDILRISRAAQMHGTEAGYETEDEDDVIPRPKGMGYRWKRTAGLDPAYDSRSRLGLDTQRAIGEMDKRFQIRKMLDELAEQDKPEELKKFTVRDSARRDMAVENRLSKLNTKTLAEAAASLQRLQQIEEASRNIIPNEEAIGLQVLGDLASRPSITGSAPPPSRGKDGSESYVGQTPPPRQQPPYLQVQTDQGPSRIPVNMSPHTQQAMNERFDAGNHPPSTQQPQHEAAPPLRSPEASRTGPAMKSPATNGNRSDVFRLLHNDSDSRPGSGPGAFDRPASHQDNTQQNREQRKEPLASPYGFGGRRDGPSSWRSFGSNQPSTVFDRRPSTNDSIPRFGFLSQGSRPSLGAFGPQDRKDERDSGRNQATMPANWLPNNLPPRPDQASQAGAADVRSQRPASPRESGRRSTLDLGRSPRSRNSSTFSIHDYRADQDKQKKQGSKNSFHKTNKAERNGIPRRQWSKQHKNLGKPLHRPGPASAISPGADSSPFGRTPDERTGPPAPWQTSGPPLQSPLGPPPPSAFGQTSAFGRPPPPFPPTMRDIFDGRDSRPQAPPSIWDNRPPNPSPSPLYAVPQPQHHPQPEYGRFGPLPPQNFPGPHHPPTPQSAPGSYGQQFGGPPLAPAGNPNFHPPGFRPQQPLPAFAQQAQQSQQHSQQNGPGNNRRRAQSDASFPKFHSWNPPSGGRR